MFRLAVIGALFVACAGSSSTGIDTAALTCPPDSTLTYENFGQPLFQDNCMSCHDSRSPKLGTVDAIRSSESTIMDVAVGTDQMPQGRSMSLEERQLLGEWLACGAP